MRGLLSPLLASDPERYAPVVADILRSTAEACRRLGDEVRALALESEVTALRASP